MREANPIHPVFKLEAVLGKECKCDPTGNLSGCFTGNICEPDTIRLVNREAYLRALAKHKGEKT